MRASALVGGAAAVNIGIGLVRTKCAAVLIGPAGVGVIGLVLNFVTLAATLGGLGLASAAVRGIAQAHGLDDLAAVVQARRTLASLSVGLAVLCGLGLWAAQGLIADVVLTDTGQASLAAWSALAVALTILSAVPIAAMNGSRRIGDMALVQVSGGALGTLGGVGALLAWGEGGIAAYVVSAPLGVLLTSLYLVRRLPGTAAPWRWHPIAAGAGPLVRLGLPLMFSGLSLTGGLLLLRAALGEGIGPVALGQFTAAWSISVTYVSLIVQAIGTDFYPRLAAVGDDHRAANQMINDQIEMSLLIAVPLFLAVQAAAPLVVSLLYSDAFAEAAGILRWQVAGDVVKVLSFPLGYLLLAQQRGGAYLVLETMFVAVFLTGALVLVPRVGIEGTGMAFLAAYGAYQVGVLWMGRRLTGFVWRGATLRLAAAGLAGLGIVGLAGARSETLSLAVGSLLTLSAAGYSVHRLELLPSIRGRMQRMRARKTRI